MDTLDIQVWRRVTGPPVMIATHQQNVTTARHGLPGLDTLVRGGAAKAVLTYYSSRSAIAA